MAMRRFWLVLLCVFPLALSAQPHTHHGGPPRLETARGPSAVFDSNGRLWLAWIHGRHVYVNYSDDFGVTFSKPVKVNAEPERVRYNGEARAHIAVDGQGNIFVAYNQTLEKRFSGNIRFSRSSDGGKHFSLPMTVNDNREVIGHAFVSMAVDNNDKLHFVWLDARDRVAAKKAGEAYRGSSLYYAYSDDHGRSISKNVRLAGHTCQCCRIALTFDYQDSPVVLWRHIFAEEEGGISRDHALLKVTEEGGLMRRVSFEKWAVDSCPHHGPSLAIDADNRYHMAWFNMDGNKPGLYYAHSDDQGKTLSPVYAFAADDPQAQHPWVLSLNGAVYLVWKSFDGERTTVKLRVSIDDGKRWRESRVIAETGGESDHPFLIHDDNQVYLSWHNADEGYLLKPVAALPQPFVRGSMAQIRARFAGEPLIVSFWSIDCPPCYRELSMWRKLSERFPHMNLLLVSTDGRQQAEEVMQVLREKGVDHLPSWQFAERHAQRLRYEIDRQWHGELPRTYFYSPTGESQAVSGLIEYGEVGQWLAQYFPAPH